MTTTETTAHTKMAAGATREGRLDARAWVLWTVAAGLLVTLTRNPLYLAIILLAVLLVRATWQMADGKLRLPLLRIAGVILLFSAGFNLLFVHVGSTVLVELPAGWPLIGGSLTVEAAAYGAINGFMLFSLLVIFLAFNNTVPGSDLVRLTPRAFHNLGLIMLIALTYVPETRRHWQQIRDAQAIRGHQIRGWRDWRPILIPLLVGGLERAMSLSEAMVARGYGATEHSGQPLRVQGLLLLGLGAAFAGWLLTFWMGWPAWVLLGSGVVTLILVVWFMGESGKRWRYDVRAWTWRETVLCASGALPVLLLLLPQTIVQTESLYYSPYPQIGLPPFDIWVGLTLLLLAVPGILPRD